MTPKFVLYADDDADDKDWVVEAAAVTAPSLQFRFVENGRQVLEYLLHASPEAYPVLIVLDLNMPELDGRQTLRRLKTHPSYQHIPVAIVTTSTNKMDRDVCRQLGASLFLTKPDTHHEWQSVINNFMPFLS